MGPLHFWQDSLCASASRPGLWDIFLVWEHRHTTAQSQPCGAVWKLRGLPAYHLSGWYDLLHHSCIIIFHYLGKQPFLLLLFTSDNGKLFVYP